MIALVLEDRLPVVGAGEEAALTEQSPVGRGTSEQTDPPGGVDEGAVEEVEGVDLAVQIVTLPPLQPRLSTIVRSSFLASDPSNSLPDLSIVTLTLITGKFKIALARTSTMTRLTTTADIITFCVFARSITYTEIDTPRFY